MKCIKGCPHPPHTLQTLCQPLIQQPDLSALPQNAYFKVCRQCPAVHLAKGIVNLDILKERFAESVAQSIVSLGKVGDAFLDTDLCPHTLLRFIGRVGLRNEESSTKGDKIVADGSFPVYQCVFCAAVTDVRTLLECIRDSTTDGDTLEGVTKLLEQVTANAQQFNSPLQNIALLGATETEPLKSNSIVGVTEYWALGHNYLLSMLDQVITVAYQGKSGSSIAICAFKAVEAALVAFKAIEQSTHRSALQNLDSEAIRRGCARIRKGIVTVVDQGRHDVAFGIVSLFASYSRQQLLLVLQILGNASCNTLCGNHTAPQQLHALIPLPLTSEITGNYHFHAFEEFYRHVVVTTRSRRSLFSSKKWTEYKEYIEKNTGHELMAVGSTQIASPHICIFCGFGGGEGGQQLPHQLQNSSTFEMAVLSYCILPAKLLPTYAASPVAMNPNPNAPYSVELTPSSNTKQYAAATVLMNTNALHSVDLTPSSNTKQYAVSPMNPNPKAVHSVDLTPSSNTKQYPTSRENIGDAEKLAAMFGLSIGEAGNVLELFNGNLERAIESFQLNKQKDKQPENKTRRHYQENMDEEVLRDIARMFHLDFEVFCEAVRSCNGDVEAVLAAYNKQ